VVVACGDGQEKGWFGTEAHQPESAACTKPRKLSALSESLYTILTTAADLSGGASPATLQARDL